MITKPGLSLYPSITHSTHFIFIVLHGKHLLSIISPPSPTLSIQHLVPSKLTIVTILPHPADTMSSNVLKYYKLLVTLPSLRLTMLMFLTTTTLTIIFHKPFILLEDVLVVLLLYEHKVLNSRRLFFLLSLVNIIYILRMDALAALFIGVSSLLLAPSFITPFVVTLPLWVLDIKAIVPLIPFTFLLIIAERMKASGFGVYWLRAWMNDDYYPLERFVHSYGKNAEATTIKIGNVAFTDVHFGLMRFSMSSLMPHLMALRGFIPHRLCGSHERNASSRWEMYKILKSLTFTNDDVNEKIDIKIMDGNKINVYDIKEVRIVEHKEGADDLPCIENLTLADPHNCEGDRPNAEELMRELGTLKYVEGRSCSSVEVCKVKLNGKGLCWERGYLIKYICDRPFKHLILFSNNMKKCYREELKKMYDLTVVSTVDDHTRSGIGRNTYEPASDVRIVSIDDCEKIPLSYAVKKIRYMSMGDVIFSDESMKRIEKCIKLGLVVTTISVILALIV